ncbi:hypothetical protein NTJ12_002506 [Flavobacterium psychrophilum]|nr:hypothetical protein [Flavobacterium psychrophilum]
MKKLLFVRVTEDVLTNSVNSLFEFYKHFNIVMTAVDIRTVEELEPLLKDKKYDYIYLAGHGDEICFSDNKDFNLTWKDIGTLLCKMDCLTTEGIVMLYCCNGGITNVVYTLMGQCPNIKYVCGAKQSVRSIEISTAFTMFLYNHEYRGIDPVISAQKASFATDIRLECYDRCEVENNSVFYSKYCANCNEEYTEE